MSNFKQKNLKIVTVLSFYQKHAAHIGIKLSHVSLKNQMFRHKVYQ